MVSEIWVLSFGRPLLSIHTFLAITKPPGYEDYKTLQCGNYTSIFSYLLQIIYMFLQLVMIFKFHNVIVNRSKRLARVAFMHCIASSLCFWIGNIILETFDVEIQDLIKQTNKSM